MTGRKIISNTRRLLTIWGLLAAVWTCIFVLSVLRDFVEIDAGKEAKAKEAFAFESKEHIPLALSASLWLVGVLLMGAGIWHFSSKVKYGVDYDGHLIEVEYTWRRKQLSVDGELQDESTETSFARIDLQGRIKSGQGTGKQVKASFPYGTYSPICANIDDRVVFRG